MNITRTYQKSAFASAFVTSEFRPYFSSQSNYCLVLYYSQFSSFCEVSGYRQC